MSRTAKQSTRLVEGPQIAAARMLLGWSQSELAGRSDTTRKTVYAFESGQGISDAKRDQILDVLEANGISFINTTNAVGVVLGSGSGRA